MHVELRTVNTDMAEVLKGYIERRLRFALSRFGARVGRILVTIAKEPGAEATCRISAQIVPFGRVGVKESDPDLFSAVDRAAGRVGRLFSRKLERARQALSTRESIRVAA